MAVASLSLSSRRRCVPSVAVLAKSTRGRPYANHFPAVYANEWPAVYANEYPAVYATAATKPCDRGHEKYAASTTFP